MDLLIVAVPDEILSFTNLELRCPRICTTNSTHNRALEWNSFGCSEHTFATIEKGNGLDLKTFCFHAFTTQSTITHTFASFLLYISHLRTSMWYLNWFWIKPLAMVASFCSLLTTPWSILIPNQVLRFRKGSSTYPHKVWECLSTAHSTY